MKVVIVEEKLHGNKSRKKSVIPAEHIFEYETDCLSSLLCEDMLPLT